MGEILAAYGAGVVTGAIVTVALVRWALRRPPRDTHSQDTNVVSEPSNHGQVEG